MGVNIFITGVISVGIFVAVLLFYTERKDKKELYLLGKRKKVIEYYLQKLSDIDNLQENNHKKIEEIKLLSKKLFNEYYGTDLAMSYSQLKTFFEEKSNTSLTEFSEMMLDCYYCSKEIDNKTIEKLISILRKEIIHSKTHEPFRKIISGKVNEEKDSRVKFLLKKAKKHIAEKDYSSAERAHGELEETNINPKFYNKINRVYDKIINLYTKQKKANENS